MKTIIALILFFQSHSLYYNIKYIDHIVLLTTAYENYKHINYEHMKKDEEKYKIIELQESMLKLLISLQLNKLEDYNYLMIAKSLKSLNDCLYNIVDDKFTRVTRLSTNQKLLELIIENLSKNRNYFNDKFIKKSYTNIILNISDELENLLEQFDSKSIKISYFKPIEKEINNLAKHSFY